METTGMETKDLRNVEQNNEELNRLKQNAEFWMKQYNEEKKKFEALQKTIQGLLDFSKVL